LRAGVDATLHRAAYLYSTFVALTLAFVGLYLFTDFPLWMDRTGGLGVKTPLDALIGTLTLHYSYHGTDIILVYVLVVAATPLVFYLLSLGRWTWVSVAPGSAGRSTRPRHRRSSCRFPTRASRSSR
jgi:hypothetical protein